MRHCGSRPRCWPPVSGAAWHGSCTRHCAGTCVRPRSRPRQHAMLRREVVKALGSLFGLGAGTPSRFPYPDRPQPAPGLGPGGGQNVRARTVIVFGPAGTVSGVFVYAPGTTPGPGNPPIAAMTASATDPFGNDVQPGDASALGTIIAIGA